MQIDYSPKQSGKTERLIRWAAETQGTIVTFSEMEKRRIIGRARDMGLDILPPLNPSEFLNGAQQGRAVRNLAIDNADLFLSALAASPIDWITLTCDPSMKSVKAGGYFGSEYPAEVPA